MKLGMIGLGKMGYNLALNIIDNGHSIVGTDVDAELVKKITTDGGDGVHTIEELVKQLPTPRVIWVMVPPGEVTGQVIKKLSELLLDGDIVIDGGNSHYQDSIQRSALLKEKGIFFFDIGTSGGIAGARKGACTMIGGDPEVFKTIEPLFKDISVENGYLYTGPVGSGHFLKMIHNGIEYGMMQSIAEGFDILKKVNLIMIMNLLRKYGTMVQ